MKKRLVSALMAFALVASMLAGCSGNADSEPAEDAAQEETADEGESKLATTDITVVGTGSFYPVIYTDDDGNLTGFEHDIIEEIAERAGLNVTWELSDDYAAMFSGLDSGKYDTIAAQISYTEERAETYAFTDKYCANEIKMCVRGDDEAETVDDLQGRKVCIEYGTVIGDYFETYNEEHGEDEQIELITTEGNIYDELNVEHYDAFPITVLSFDSVMEKGEYDFKLIGDPIIIDYQAFPFSKDADPALVESFNTAIQEMKDDGTLLELSQKYYGRDMITPIED